MNKELNIFTKLACKFVGWNPILLKECGEASFRALRKYISAFVILGVVWGTIGYLFAGKYLGIETLLAKGCIAAVFIAIVICIERFIILKIGQSIWTATARVIIALLMSTLGATIFDQMIFKNDLAVALVNARDELEKTTVANRSMLIDQEIKDLEHDRDSIKQVVLPPMYQEFIKNPTIQTAIKTRERKAAGLDSTGKVVYGYEDKVEITSASNPIGNQIASEEDAIGQLQERIKELKQNKLTLASIVHDEISSKPTGFLEELKILFRDIIMKDNVALFFYLCLFFFMMSLEMLVVTSKMGEKDCDYDLIVEHQLLLKEEAFRKAHGNLV